MINLSSQNSLLNKFLAEIRDTKIQKDRMRFRKNLERIGEIFAMEISKTLTYEEQSVTTPLGEALINLNSDKIVLGCILRASLPLHQGLLIILMTPIMPLFLPTENTIKMEASK